MVTKRIVCFASTNDFVAHMFNHPKRFFDVVAKHVEASSLNITSKSLCTHNCAWIDFVHDAFEHCDTVERCLTVGLVPSEVGRLELNSFD